MYVCMYVCISVMIPTARIYPSLAFNVDEASWNMTKSMMMFKKAVDGLHTEDFEKFRVEEFIRTGTDTIKLLCKLNECNKQDYLIGKVMDIPVEDSAEKSVAPLSQESPVKVMITTHYYALLNALNFPKFGRPLCPIRMERIPPRLVHTCIVESRVVGHCGIWTRR